MFVYQRVSVQRRHYQFCFDSFDFFVEHDNYMYNVGKTIINHPPVTTIFIAGISNSQMGSLLLFYPHRLTSTMNAMDAAIIDHVIIMKC